jgi:hypothetical protein
MKEGVGMSKVEDHTGKLGGWQDTEGLSFEAMGSHCSFLLREVTRTRLFNGTLTEGQE